jgi:hypothetical protein
MAITIEFDPSRFFQARGMKGNSERRTARAHNKLRLDPLRPGAHQAMDIASACARPLLTYLPGKEFHRGLSSKRGRAEAVWSLEQYWHMDAKRTVADSHTAADDGSQFASSHIQQP